MSVTEDQKFQEDDNLGQIDWENLWFSESPLLADSSSTPQPPPPAVFDCSSNSSPNLVFPWIEEMERVLMKDDADFVAGLIVDDSPAEDSAGDVDRNDEESEKVAEKEEKKVLDDGAVVGNAEDVRDPDDHISKKRMRQLRNRDAAVRSRERKKIYVRDLEMKSKYLEAECRRLGQLLQFYVAENQALQLRLQKCGAFGVTLAKQESAVLLLESLLLGSLLWFMGIICLFTLPIMSPSVLVAVQPQSEEEKVPKIVDPKGAGRSSNSLISLEVNSYLNSRGCKASRTRMKPRNLVLSSLGVKLSSLVF